MSTIHINGYPRIGGKRELKFAVEKYWRGEITEAEVQQVAADIRLINLQTQKNNGLDLLPVGDFSFYDHVLDAQILVGAIPQRFGFDVTKLSLNQYFELARGNKTQPALEMTKWFDTNYHYLVPEWTEDTEFQAVTEHLVEQIKEAQIHSPDIKPTLIGPLTLLWLGKTKNSNFNRLDLLPKLVATYQSILRELVSLNISWVQIDEPILVTDLPEEWLRAYENTYKELSLTTARIILGTYFDSVSEHVDLLKKLSIHGIHIDCVRAPEQFDQFVNQWPVNKVLSLGVIDGRNVWRADLSKILDKLLVAKQKFANNLWVSTSCSLLHTPQDLDVEENIPSEIKNWLAFSKQKLQELFVLKNALVYGKEGVKDDLNASDSAASKRRESPLIHKQVVAQRLENLAQDADKRTSPFAVRIEKQHALFNLPLLPTTNIGSFPQTVEIRQARAKFKKGELNQAEYETAIKAEIAHVVKVQEELDLDVLVHGEAERNDMVEYFGEQLEGFIFTQYGWVQSYGSRCVKPPIIYGDVLRNKAMTVAWTSYAQSLTTRPMKGMLTGPVTILQWSFVRDDLPRSDVCQQIALALNDEVLDLEKAGIKIIQIDEPAIREGLPLKRQNWAAYLNWAGKCFRLSHSNVVDDTQVHTHMCYSEFHDILDAIAAMDADVITIETSRSDMELLDAFAEFKYPNDIGPGVYDIHSPRIPEESELVHLIDKALKVIPAAQLWINPDCGLKTRDWPETKLALERMVKITKQFRTKLV